MQGIVSLAAVSASRTTPDRSTGAAHPASMEQVCLVAVDDEQRPDQVVSRQHVLAHHAAGPFGAPVASHADRKIERSGIGSLACLLFDRHEADFPLQRSAELYGHQNSPGALFSGSHGVPLPSVANGATGAVNRSRLAVPYPPRLQGSLCLYRLKRRPEFVRPICNARRNRASSRRPRCRWNPISRRGRHS